MHTRDPLWWGACTPRASQRVGEAHGGPPGRRMEGWECWAAHTRKRGEAWGGQPESGGEWAAKPPHQPAQPQCANYWGPLMQKRHQQKHRRSSRQNTATRHST